MVGFAAEEGKGEVGNDTCAEKEREGEDLLVGGLGIYGFLVDLGRGGTDHRFPMQRLEKAVQDPRECVRAHTRPPNQTRILLHAFLPIVAYSLHRRHSGSTIALVILVLARTPSHLCHDLVRGFACFFVYVGLYR